MGRIVSFAHATLPEGAKTLAGTVFARRGKAIQHALGIAPSFPDLARLKKAAE
jgi:hypothetical protein